MSGRDTSKATDGNKTLRSQSGQSQGSNTGSAGRGPGGKGQGPPIPGDGGGAGALDAGDVRSAEGPLRPPVFSTSGSNNLHLGDAPRISFGSAIGSDGNVNTAPSPQQPERPSVERPTTAGRNGQGGRGSNKQSQAGRRQINSAAPRLSAGGIQFGQGIPPLNQGPQMMNPMQFNPAYPSGPSGYNQQYGYGGQMYPAYAPQGGYQPYLQSPAPSPYTRQQRGGPPQGPYTQQRGQGYPSGQGSGSRATPPANGKPEKPASVPPPSAPRRAPLKIQNPQTGEEVKLGDSKAKPSEPEPTGPSMQKQPSSGGPTAKPAEQQPVNGAPPPASAAPKRVLTIAPPPSGGPSKPSPVKEKKAPPHSQEKDASKETSEAKQAAEAVARAEDKRKQEVEAEAKRAEEAAQKQVEEAAEKEAAAAEKAAAEKKAAEAKEAAEKERKAAEERASLEKAEAEKNAAAEREAVQKAEAEMKAAMEKDAREAVEREVAAQKLAAEKEAAQAKAREEEAAKEAQKREKEAAAKKEAEAAAASKKDEAVPGDEESASAAARPKKGKKALQDAIRRKDEETRAEVRGDADLSAYKSPAQRAAAAAPPAPPTPPPVASPVKAAPQEAAEEPSWEEEEEKKAAAPRKDEQDSKKKWKPTHVYTSDFLRSFNQNHIAKDNGLLVRTWPGLQLIEVPEVMRGQESQGRGGFRGGPPGPTGGPVAGRSGPRDLPVREEQNWNRGRPLQPPAPPGGFSGPPGALPSGPMGGMGGRGGGRGGGPHGGFPTDNDRWLRSNPLPLVPQAPKLPQLHKTANRFERGTMISENPVEEAKQKNIKSLLNKITPEKYTVIRDKLLASGIDSPLSLLGLIDQVFDKALTEPTFCEIYATLCHDLNRSLPQFDPEPEAEDQKKITFRRSLVNKCQEEFMAGTEAMEAVKQREVADAVKGDDATPEAAELEEGEISQEDKLAKRRKELVDAQNERKGRMRALGNIQFVGQLYKQAMLTEKIMHECIKTLLEDIETPRTEDVECLCKLMSTVGSQLENSTKYVKAHMDAYFERMDKMSKLPNLESRLKFMIRDVADLRKNRWQERRKTEGPKTIEEIHRDARMEAQQAARLPEPRGPRMSGGGPRGGGFGQPPMGARPPIHLQKRHEDRLEEKPRPMTRTPSQEGPLAPGGLGGSFRPGGSLGSRGSSPAPREPSAAVPEATSSAPAESQATAKAEAKPSGAGRGGGMNEEESAKKASTILNDFVVSMDTEEARGAIKEELLGRGGSGAAAQYTWITKSFEKKESERPTCKEFLLFVAESKMLSEADTRDGLSNLLEELSDMAVDVPFAPKMVAEYLGAVLAANGLPLEDLGKLLLTAGKAEDAEEGADADLVDSGIALKVLAQALKEYAAKAGKEKPVEEWKASSLDIKMFVPEFARDDALKELEKEGLADYA